MILEITAADRIQQVGPEESKGTAPQLFGDFKESTRKQRWLPMGARTSWPATEGHRTSPVRETIWNLNQVKRIEYKREYAYHIVFDDGLSAEMDFKPMLGRGPIFEPLEDIEFFKQAGIGGGTIAWPNGADVSPESLYDKVESANQRMVRTD